MTRTTKTLSNQPNRRQLLLGATASGVVVLAAPAIVRAQGTQRYLRPLVAGLNAREGDPTYISVARIPEILRDKYDVEMEIRIHPSSTLGTDLSQMEAVQTGFIDITSNATGQFAQFSRAFSFVDLPYAITNWDMALRLFDSELWAARAEVFSSETPLVPLAPVGAGGFRILWNNRREIPTPGGMNGLVVRTIQSPADVELVRAWGGNPTPLAWTETYNALRTGVVEGMHVQPIWTFGANMFEVLSHGTEVGATFAIQLQVINKASLMSMPENIRAAFLSAAREAALEANEVDRNSEEAFKKRLTDAGLQIYTPSADEKKQWQDVGEGLWDRLATAADTAAIEGLVALR